MSSLAGEKKPRKLIFFLKTIENCFMFVLRFVTKEYHDIIKC